MFSYFYNYFWPDPKNPISVFQQSIDCKLWKGKTIFVTTDQQKKVNTKFDTKYFKNISDCIIKQFSTIVSLGPSEESRCKKLLEYTAPIECASEYASEYAYTYSNHSQTVKSQMKKRLKKNGNPVLFIVKSFHNTVTRINADVWIFHTDCIQNTLQSILPFEEATVIVLSDLLPVSGFINYDHVYIACDGIKPSLSWIDSFSVFKKSGFKNMKNQIPIFDFLNKPSSTGSILTWSNNEYVLAVFP